MSNKRSRIFVGYEMKILVQNYSNGNLEMLEVPMITSSKGLLVETKASPVSVGTEKAMIDVAKKSLLGKALARPDWILLYPFQLKAILGKFSLPAHLLPISAQGCFG